MTVPLNSEQLAGVNAVEGNTVMIAGPGSGKTRVLTERHLRMRLLGIPDKNILNLTFASAAAEEMAERVGLLDSNQVFRTFHSFCLEFLKTERRHLPFRTCETIIPVRGEQSLLIKELKRIYPAVTSSQTLYEHIMMWKAQGISPDRALEESGDGAEYFCALAYRDYEFKCREQGWLDFDGLVVETIKILESNADVRVKHQKKYLAVDECQDTDTRQFRLLQLLYSGNIFAVGDENQLIYEWRSAQSGNLSNFQAVFPGTQTLYLGTNYRSTQKLVEFFRKILPVDNGLGSHMVSGRSEEGTDPVFLKYKGEDDEANRILDSITSRGIQESSAILARTNRQLQLIQRRAMSRNIRTEILGKKNVWQEPEVKHLIELLKESDNYEAPAAPIMQDLVHRHNLADTHRGIKQGQDKDPVDNLNDVVRMAARKNRETGSPLTVFEFVNWINRITHMRKRKEDPILTLSTVHQAKGREWKHVFVVGANQGTMPHKEGELLEEHRIFFVACSRAADELQISWTKAPSQFLNEFKEEFEEFKIEDHIEQRA